MSEADDIYEIIKLESGITNLASMAKRVVTLELQFEELWRMFRVMQACPEPIPNTILKRPDKWPARQEDAPVRWI